MSSRRMNDYRAILDVEGTILLTNRFRRGFEIPFCIQYISIDRYLFNITLKYVCSIDSSLVKNMSERLGWRENKHTWVISCVRFPHPFYSSTGHTCGIFT